MAAARPGKRILTRVTVDDSYGDLLQDLLSYTGRRRAKRLVFLAALGKLAERGSVSLAISGSEATGRLSARDTDEVTDRSEPALRPIDGSSLELGFLSKLRDNLS